MNINPVALLALISSLATQIASLEAENTQLKDELSKR